MSSVIHAGCSGIRCSVFQTWVSGDRWCLCVTRWVEAFKAGMAPQVVLEATHIHALEFIALEDLQAHAVR